MWGNSRPASEFEPLAPPPRLAAPRPSPLRPAEPRGSVPRPALSPGLRPLRLVQKHIACLEAQVSIEPRYAEEQAVAAAPAPSETKALAASPPARLAYLDPPEEPEHIPLRPISRRSVRYNVNDRLERARQRRLSPPPPASKPITPPPLPPLPQLLARTPSPRLPVLPTLEEQHTMALEALRAQGSWLPDLIREAERGLPLLVPPQYTRPASPAQPQPKS